MSVEYTITRKKNSTGIARRDGMAVQHYVLWSHQVVEMRFSDGIRVEHREVLTYIENRNAPISRDVSTALEAGEGYTIKLP